MVIQATTRDGVECVSKNFQGVHMQLVIGGYANKFPQETSVGRFLTPFPYLILTFGPNPFYPMNYCLIDMLLWTELIQLKE